MSSHTQGNKRIVIALDAMGGDHGPKVIAQAAIKVLDKHEEIELILVGDEGELTQTFQTLERTEGERLKILHASQVVGMDDLPSQALRRKKDSSMRVAINLVKLGTAHACVSAGNTGALMAMARFVLKTLPGIDRPAICTALPTIKGHTHVLDLGANIDISANHLFQFAVMGSVLTSAVDDIQSPTIGLLNIGAEEIKGNDRIKEAALLLNNSCLNYVGFVEGDDISQGAVDVVVCDGFVGNVMLKATEGVAKMISHFMRQEFNRNILTRAIGLVSMPVINAFRKRVDPRAYNGASLVGLQGIVVKSHGDADVYSFATAIGEAILEVQKNVPGRIRKQLEPLLVGRKVI